MTNTNDSSNASEDKGFSAQNVDSNCISNSVKRDPNVTTFFVDNNFITNNLLIPVRLLTKVLDIVMIYKELSKSKKEV